MVKLPIDGARRPEEKTKLKNENLIFCIEWWHDNDFNPLHPRLFSNNKCKNGVWRNQYLTVYGNVQQK